MLLNHEERRCSGVFADKEIAMTRIAATLPFHFQQLRHESFPPLSRAVPNSAPVPVKVVTIEARYHTLKLPVWTRSRQARPEPNRRPRRARFGAAARH